MEDEMILDRNAIITELDPDKITGIERLSDEELKKIYIDFNSHNPMKLIPMKKNEFYIRPPDKSFNDNLLGNPSVNPSVNPNNLSINPSINPSVNSSMECSKFNLKVLGNPLGQNIIKKKITIPIPEKYANKSKDQESIKRMERFKKINEPNISTSIVGTIDTNIINNKILDTKTIEPSIEPPIETSTPTHTNTPTSTIESTIESTIDFKKCEIVMHTDKPNDFNIEEYVELKVLLKENKYKDARIYLANINNMKHARWLERLSFMDSLCLKDLIKSENKLAYDIICNID